MADQTLSQRKIEYATRAIDSLGFEGAERQKEIDLLVASVSGGEPYDWADTNKRAEKDHGRQTMRLAWPEDFFRF